MKLRGMRIDERREAQDAILDQYLTAPELTGVRATPAEMHIPKFIDMEGNEENHSQRKGNRPDIELRPQSLDKTPIIRTLNSLSEKLMAQVKPSDVDASAPIGMDETTYERLRLRDLAGDPEQERHILHVRDQSRFFAQDQGQGRTGQARYEEIQPRKAIQLVCHQLSTCFGPSGARTIHLHEDGAEEDDWPDETGESTGPRASERATTHIMSLIKQHRAQTTEIAPSSGLSTAVYDRLTF